MTETVKRDIAEVAEKRQVKPLQVAGYMLERTAYQDSKMITDLRKKIRVGEAKELVEARLMNIPHTAWLTTVRRLGEAGLQVSY